MTNLLSKLKTNKNLCEKGIKAFLMTDGGARGNPGIAGAGAVIFDENKKEIWRGGKFCGVQTNNFAEYQGLILGLEKAKVLKITDLEVFMDSKLIIEQMNGHWKIKNINIKPLWEKAKNLSEHFHKVSFSHIPREKNKTADFISNQVMDLKKDI